MIIPKFATDANMQVSITTATTLEDALVTAGEERSLLRTISEVSLYVEDNNIRLGGANTPTTSIGMRIPAGSYTTIKAPLDRITVISETGTAKVNIIPGIQIANFNS